MKHFKNICYTKYFFSEQMYDEEADAQNFHSDPNRMITVKSGLRRKVNSLFFMIFFFTENFKFII